MIGEVMKLKKKKVGETYRAMEKKNKKKTLIDDLKKKLERLTELWKK